MSDRYPTRSRFNTRECKLQVWRRGVGGLPRPARHHTKPQRQLLSSATSTAMPSAALRVVRFRPAIRARAFHLTIPRSDLVGPPDPVSNLRPVVYDDAPPLPPSAVRHPYSLKEFTGDTREYQWKIQRQELDAYNHAFWTDVCTLMFMRLHYANKTKLWSEQYTVSDG